MIKNLALKRRLTLNSLIMIISFGCTTKTDNLDLNPCKEFELIKPSLKNVLLINTSLLRNLPYEEILLINEPLCYKENNPYESNRQDEFIKYYQKVVNDTSISKELNEIIDFGCTNGDFSDSIVKFEKESYDTLFFQTSSICHIQGKISFSTKVTLKKNKSEIWLFCLFYMVRKEDGWIVDSYKPYWDVKWGNVPDSLSLSK